MVKGATSPILHLIRRGVTASRELPDQELLLQFRTQHDPGAFHALLQRHGTMVLDVCRGVLGNEADAEDAFQATFLVLARKAASIRKSVSVGSWLHGVAHRTALKARARSATRRKHEVRAPADRASLQPASKADELSWREVRQVLHEELSGLSERYRAALVLCYLEGATQEAAALQLRLPRGTLRERLERGRALLRTRLERRGLGPAAVLLAGAWPAANASACVSNSLVSATVQAAACVAAGKTTATGLVSANVAVLTEGVLTTMMLTKLKTATLAFLLLILAGIGASLLGTSFLGASVLGRQQTTCKQVGAAKEDDPPSATAQKTGESDKASADFREMRGTWTSTEIVMETRNGEALPPRERKVTHIISDGKLIDLGDDGLIDQERSIKLDPTKMPKSIDLTSLRTGTLSGIYELDGDTLKIHFGGEPGRPTEFPAKDPDLKLRRVSRTPEKTAQRFANAPGCFWMVEPSSPSASMSTLGLVFIYEKDRDGAALITLAGALPESRQPEYRPVLLDAGKKRYLPNPLPPGGSSGGRGGVVVALSRWRMDPKVLPFEKVALIGIEAPTPEFHRIVAREALEQARKEGLEVLPYPELGKSYDFTLTTTDGKKIRSQDLRGKVIVIDCWATWCSPCMTLLPEIKELYQKRHKDGLEVIGVSLDDDIEKMKKACKRLSLDWPQVMVPSGNHQRDLWQKASGISSIPRLLVIDRDGILRVDNPKNLDQEVDRLLRKSATKGHG